MSYQFYKLLHFVGIFLLLLSLGMILFANTPDDRGKALKRPGFILHGASWLIVLIAGMGLAARLGLMAAFPKWTIAKLGIWMALGAMAFFLRRKPQLVRLNISLILALATLAAWLAVYKPN